ncbi:ATP-binding protein [Isoptericola sp. S6320L]|uniref:AAA family ATPase n=1 Tax=Isoptericola sp. S6320L TaxID=2926411 RepID=UPI001FF1EA73|nr:ATP-binding protein [Isoptericola sp. S6320L]MCK0116470.1 ATP-binding protein [Isoptericola sp. S6320L]
MPTIPRPADLFDRTVEWSDLTNLARADTSGLRIGIVTGRRRHGKSYVLRRVAHAVDGLYHQARELERRPALDQFALDVADHLDLDPDSLRFDNWEAALRVALGMRRGARTTRRRGGTRLLVIDELPYLLAHSPEIPSVLQLLYDEAQSDPDVPPTVVILCGSSLSVMRDLLTGSKPLRGRAQLELTMPPFDYRQSRQYWGIDDPAVAFHVDAILGGTPGYKQLVTAPPPATVDGLQAWLGSQVLSPAAALFNEKSFLLREDPRNLDKAVYHSVLQAVADGHRSPTAIGSAIGREYNTLKHPLGILEAAGFLLRLDDVLTRRRPLYYLADPVIRFAQVVIDPYRALLEERDVAAAWHAADASYSAQVLGPHFEHLARVWTARFSGDRWGTPVGEVGPAVVNDSKGRSQHELDVVALPRGRRRHDDRAPIVMLGEAKSTTKRRTRADLRRLQHIRDVLHSSGRDVRRAHLALFSRAGFDDSLVAEAADHDDVHLVTLEDLYSS